MTVRHRTHRHIRRHWHHHTLIIATALMVLSFTVGAGAARLIGTGGYQPGPLPPPIHVAGVATPPRHSLARFIVRLHDQGLSNSCVGQTLSTIKEITVHEHRIKNSPSPAHGRGQRVRAGRSFDPFEASGSNAVKRGVRVIPSPWFSSGYIYDQVNHGTDNGATYQDAFAVLQSQGIAKYARFPHDGQDYWVQPDASARTNAIHYRITTWRSIDPSDRPTIQYEIAHGRPVAVAIPIDDYFFNAGNWYDTALHTVSQWGGSIHFWHSMTIVGYDRTGVIILNSWGSDFGYHGLIRITWSVLAHIQAGGVPAQIVVSTPAFHS